METRASLTQARRARRRATITMWLTLAVLAAFVFITVYTFVESSR
jgi:predicted nucleic acid-binding Zn ribbon protein